MTSAIVSPTHSAELALSRSSSGHDLRQDRHPRRPEEDRDGGDQEDQRVDQDDVGDRGDRDDQDDRGAQDVADDHHLLVVPAVDERARDRAEQQVRERGREEDEPGRERRPGRDGDDRDERQLVEPVAEQRDELARPERRERAVEREADVWVLADPLDRLGRRPRDRIVTAPAVRARARTVERRARPGPGPALPMTSGRSSATDAAERREAVSAPASPVAAAVAGSSRACLWPRALLVELRRTRTTAANRKKARPRVRKASPIEATFWTIGSGIGMTSANGPRWSRKLASSGGGRM